MDEIEEFLREQVKNKEIWAKVSKEELDKSLRMLRKYLENKNEC